MSLAAKPLPSKRDSDAEPDPRRAERIRTETVESLQRWNGLAKVFDQFTVVTEQGWRELLQHMHMDTARSVLETGCGQGDCAEAYLPTLAPGCSATIIDFSDEMVRATTTKLSKLLVPDGSVSVRQANAMDLSTNTSRSVDRYFSNLTLHSVPDADAMLAEAARVLTADGIAGFTVWGRPSHSLMFTLKPGYDRNSNFDFGSDEQQIRARFRAAGFSKVRLWERQCVLELWDPSQVVAYWTRIEGRDVLGADRVWAEQLFENVREALESGRPVGLEVVVILAKL